jgi:hypothetical protein
MTMLLQIGIAYPHELSGGIGHVACTLGGVNYESRGSRGCLKGSAARGATSPLFRHHFHREVTEAQAKTAKRYADGCVGEPYVWDRVPTSTHGGDCSGYVSGIICAALGKDIHRLFSTGTWTEVRAGLGFATGLGGGVAHGAATAGVADRPYPGYEIRAGSRHPGHIKWIQARVNFARHNHPKLDVDGEFGPLTRAGVKAFQSSHHLERDGKVGHLTWAALNHVR